MRGGGQPAIISAATHRGGGGLAILRALTALTQESDMARPEQPLALDEFPDDGPPPLTAAEHPHVEEVPGRNGGYPVLRDTRIAVRTIVNIHRQGRSLAETLTSFHWLPREQVEGALDYYVRFPDRINQDIEREERAYAEHLGKAW